MSNVLLKITIPRRRRKVRPGRSEDVPMQSVEEEDCLGETAILLERLQKSNGNYKAEVLGTVSQSVRFRDIADFQYSTARSPFAKRVYESLGECDCEPIPYP